MMIYELAPTLSIWESIYLFILPTLLQLYGTEMCEVDCFQLPSNTH
jgi:hypothetical protein